MKHLREYTFQAANQLVTEYIYIAEHNLPTPTSLGYGIYFLFKAIEHDELFLDEFQSWLKANDCPQTLIKVIIGFIRQSAPLVHNPIILDDVETVITRAKGTSK